MQPLNQKLDMVITQLSQPNVNVPVQPERRSYQPPPNYAPPTVQQAPVQKSETPGLQSIIRKTVGM
jgi:hypothetical protein